MRFAVSRALIGIALGSAAATPAPAVEPPPAVIEPFQVRTAADLVSLCDTPQSAATYVAAIHFCHGFAVGAFQYYLAVTEQSPEGRFVCVPDPRPSRNEAIAAFVAWAKARPEFMGDPPVDVLFRFLSDAYPCDR